MSEDQKKKFFEVILLEKDYNKARIDLDIAGIQLTDRLESWLKSYYGSLVGYNPSTMEGPKFKLSEEFGNKWINDLLEVCSERGKYD